MRTTESQARRDAKRRNSPRSPERTMEEKFTNAALPPKEMSAIFLDYEIKSSVYLRLVRMMPGRWTRAILSAIGATYYSRKVARKFEVYMACCKRDQQVNLRRVLDR